MRRILLVMVTCFGINYCYSQQGISVNSGGFSSGLAGISTVLSGADALLTNFSSSIGSTSPLFHASTARRFNLSELSSFSAAAAIPIRNNSYLGLELSSYGFEFFQDRLVSLKYAHRLSENIALSGAFGLDMLDLGDFGQKSTFTYQLGLSGTIVTGLRFGFTASNIDTQNIEPNTRLISDIRIGFAYELSDKVQLLAELDKPLSDELSVKVGLDYALHSKFSVRTGYNSSPGQTSFGFSYGITDNLGLDFAALYDPLLGITPVISFVWEGSRIDDSLR